MDTLFSLRVFRQIVESGSFVAAARKLRISTAMASKHLTHLENYVGARLLNRTTRRLSLTESGQAYYDLSNQAVSDLDEARRVVRETTLTPRGTLRVNCLVSFGVSHLMPGISAYTTKFPQVVIELTLNDRVVDLVEEGIDVAIRAMVPELHTSSLIARQIASARFVACATRGYLKRHSTPKEPAELLHHNCLTYAYADGAREWVFGNGEDRHRITVTGNLVSNNGDAVRAGALCGNGIAFLPTDIVGADLRAGRLVALFPQWKQPDIGIYAVYPSRRHLSAKVRSFVDFLTDRFARKPF